MSGQVNNLLALFLCLEKKMKIIVFFFVLKFWYIKKLLYLCNTIKHRIINL